VLQVAQRNDRLSAVASAATSARQFGHHIRVFRLWKLGRTVSSPRNKMRKHRELERMGRTLYVQQAPQCKAGFSDVVFPFSPNFAGIGTPPQPEKIPLEQNRPVSE
jgi:hypothetical protein